jgi:hypothetical protein
MDGNFDKAKISCKPKGFETVSSMWCRQGKLTLSSRILSLLPRDCWARGYNLADPRDRAQQRLMQERASRTWSETVGESCIVFGTSPWCVRTSTDVTP